MFRKLITCCPESGLIPLFIFTVRDLFNADKYELMSQMYNETFFGYNDGQVITNKEGTSDFDKKGLISNKINDNNFITHCYTSLCHIK